MGNVLSKKFLLRIGFAENDKSYILLTKATGSYFDDSVKNLTKQQINEADAVFVFAFGQGEDKPPTPSRTNKGLAAICSQLIDVPNLNAMIRDTIQNQFRYGQPIEGISLPMKYIG